MTAPVWIPTVSGNRPVIRGEMVLCDGELAVIKAWNDIPTFYVELLKGKKLKEVEPWRLTKIEKVQL